MSYGPQTAARTRQPARQPLTVLSRVFSMTVLTIPPTGLSPLNQSVSVRGIRRRPQASVFPSSMLTRGRLQGVRAFICHVTAAVSFHLPCRVLAASSRRYSVGESECHGVHRQAKWVSATGRLAARNSRSRLMKILRKTCATPAPPLVLLQARTADSQPIERLRGRGSQVKPLQSRSLSLRPSSCSGVWTTGMRASLLISAWTATSK